jgi:hypothetical protein
MLGLGDPSHRLDERRPGALLHAEHLSAGGREAVIPAAPLRRLLDPAAFEQAACLEAIQKGIEGGDVEAQRAAGSRLDELPDLVAVAGSVLDER